jgi:hypothetical protein
MEFAEFLHNELRQRIEIENAVQTDATCLVLSKCLGMEIPDEEQKEIDDTPKEQLPRSQVQQQQPMHALTVNEWFDCAAQMTASGTQKLWISETNTVSKNNSSNRHRE